MPYKVVILGDAGVGKSNLHTRFIYDQYQERHTATIGVDFGVKRFEFGTRHISVHVWDTAGQERFQAMAIRTYLRNAMGVVLVYDITNRETFEHILSWKRHVDTSDLVCRDVICILIGNKADLEKEREVTTNEALQLADCHSMLFMEASAKVGTNVEQIFRLLIGEIDLQEMNQKSQERSPLYEECSCMTQQQQFSQSFSLSCSYPPPSYSHRNCCS